MSTTTNEGGGAAATDFRIPAGSKWAGSWRIAAGVGVFGLGIAAVGAWKDPTRFAYAYLFGYVVALSLALGSLFFVIVQFVTKAGWSVTVRRLAELMMRPMLVFAVLSIPLFWSIPRIFPWAGAKHAETAEVSEGHATDTSILAEERGEADREPAAMRGLNRPAAQNAKLEHAVEGEENEIVLHKRFLLNRGFFQVRLVLYLFIWFFLADKYFGWSSEQDSSKALRNTASAQSFAPGALILFGLSLSFFAFDWMLSLDATWYSTIFGVTVFASCAMFGMACLILLSMALRRSGLLPGALNVEHLHDMGKLLFGWISFWSYVNFAQFFLVWYSNIPDEVAWFHKRWSDGGGTWKGLSLSLVVMHFFVPFWFLMSRNIKRAPVPLAMAAVCMVVMHILDMYWIILPNYGALSVSPVDIGCLIGVFGVYAAFVLRGMEGFPLVPVGDPRLSRALEYENA